MKLICLRNPHELSLCIRNCLSFYDGHNLVLRWSRKCLISHLRVTQVRINFAKNSMSDADSKMT